MTAIAEGDRMERRDNRRWRGVTTEDEEAVTSDDGEATRVRQSRAHLGWKLYVVR
jgi:hypothetical protein